MRKGSKHTIETKQKISLAHKGDFELFSKDIDLKLKPNQIVRIKEQTILNPDQLRKYINLKCSLCGKYRLVRYDYAKKRNFKGLCHKCNINHHMRENGRIVKRVMENANGWLGGKHKASNGYIALKIPENHPFICMAGKRGEIYEHRLIMAQKIGRQLTKFEHVHHLNKDKTDNRIENLILINADTHVLITRMEAEIKRLEKKLEECNKYNLLKNN